MESPSLRWNLWLFAATKRLPALFALRPLLVALALLTCTAAAARPSTVGVVTAYYAALDARDLEGVVGLFADQPLVTFTSLSGSATTLHDAAALRDYYARYYLGLAPVTFRVLDVRVRGDQATVNAQMIWSINYPPILVTEYVTVRDGRITALTDDAGDCRC